MKQSITIRMNAWIICIILLLANLVTIALWQPWNARAASNRKISVTGTTTIQTEADQYVFTPYYQQTGKDKVTINSDLGKLSTTIVGKLKTLGVKDSAIKTSISSYDNGISYPASDNSGFTGTLSITITIQDKNLAQKVQDYLVTTSASGSISPQISFSVDKQKTLETQARDQALTDAKNKAQASVQKLGATLGRVISITDSTSNSGHPLPWEVMPMNGSTRDSKETTSSSYTIQPGLNDYVFSIQVDYELN